MALIARLLTISGLEIELGIDRRTLGKKLATIPPDGRANGRDAWCIKTVIAALNDADGQHLNPAAEKARLDKARADLAELDLAIKEGRLVPAAAIEKAWGNIATALRIRLMAIPTSTAPRIVPKMTTAEIETVIREQIDEALASISSASIEIDDQDSEIASPDGRDNTNSGEAQAIAPA